LTHASSLALNHTQANLSQTHSLTLSHDLSSFGPFFLFSVFEFDSFILNLFELPSSQARFVFLSSHPSSFQFVEMPTLIGTSCWIGTTMSRQALRGQKYETFYCAVFCGRILPYFSAYNTHLFL